MENLIDQLNREWLALSPNAQDVISVLLIIAAVLVLRVLLVQVMITQLRRITRRTMNQLDDIIFSHAETPLRYLSIALILFLILGIFDLNPKPAQVIDRVAQMLVVFSLGLLIYRVISHMMGDPYWLERIWGITIQEPLIPFVRTGIQIIVISLATVIVIDIWGYDVNALIAGLGIGGLAVALAAQETLSNLFGFSTIVGDQPFVVGEYIKTPDVEGSVEHVGLRSTRIRQLDQAIVTVPNSKLSSAPILNWSRLSKRRIDFVLRLAYGTTSGQMRAFLKDLRQLLINWEAVETDTVVVYFINMGASALEVLVRCYIQKADWGEFTAEKELIQLAIMELVEKHELKFALPSQALYIESLPEVKTSLPRYPENPTTDRSSRYIPIAPDGDIDVKG